jgi:uncharacterized DUF497 family protein
VPPEFTWDPRKAERNLRVHGVSFEIAVEVFDDPNHLVTENYFFADKGKQRYQIIGLAGNLLLLLVVFVDASGEGEEILRIISARKANAYEESAYADQFRR